MSGSNQKNYSNSGDKHEASAEDCGVRDKYAKPWDEKHESYFQLYTTYSKPGLVSIFYNEDQRSFHNWGLEVGSGPKRGRIREAIDHQINTPVLEIAGHHNGSVYMVCPPDPDSTINVDMPFITMLMKDMHGYSSVEFTVLDTLGFSRKISAKNFKSRCTIGELNCEIPMRLSPTWNYACVNLDDTLRNAFGTRLVSVQRIKINANVRVRRIYFHDEIIPFKSLPQEFRIKLQLTPQEKQEIHMYEEFLYNEPNTSPERSIPWSMPRLMITKQTGFNALRMSTANVLQTQFRRKVEIMEVPMREDDLDKYSNVSGNQTHSNSVVLRDMLHKSIPPSKILLPTLSLIYPDKKGHEEAALVQSGKVEEYLHKKGKKESKFFGRESLAARKHDACASGAVDETTDNLRKMKKCIEVVSPGVDAQDENGSSQGSHSQTQTDWERFHFHGHHESRAFTTANESRTVDKHEYEKEFSGETSPRVNEYNREHHHHHATPHGCGKYTVHDLAKYLKHRETHGDYDMFAGTVKNSKFLVVPDGEAADNQDSGDSESEEDSEQSEDVNFERKSTFPENRFLLSKRASSTNSLRMSSRPAGTRESRPSRLGLQTKLTEGEQTIPNSTATETDVHTSDSWVLTWTYTGISWARTREINQKLLNDAREYFAGEHQNRKRSMFEAGLSFQQQLQQLSNNTQGKYQRGSVKLPEAYRCAVPMLPRVMKEDLRGTGGYYDVIVDNPTLPIDHY